jgi:hypothetical protein
VPDQQLLINNPLIPPPPEGQRTPITAGKDIPISKKLEIKGDKGNTFHSNIVGRLKQRLNLSQEYISDRYDEWNRVDEHVRLYIDLSRRARLADKSESSRTAEMPFQRAIVVPLSYAILTTRLAQYMAMFTSRDSLLEIEGRSPDDVKAAKKMEALLSYDLGQTNGILSWYQLVQDAEKYGLGVMYDSWEEEYGWVTDRPPTTGIPWQDAVMKALMPPKRQWKKVKEYNSWSAVDPYCYWPDPRVCKNDLQNSEYMGHRIYRGKMYLLERTEKNGGPYFNIDSVDSYVGKASIDLNRLRMAGGLAEYNVRNYADDKDRGFFALDAMQVKIIPKEWELGTSEEPEIWWFTMLEEGLIIRAHRGSYDHNQFTYSVAESNYDSHCLFNPGTMENLDGIQRMMNWSLNSTIENRMKALNDAIIYGPSFIEEDDLLFPGPAKHVRLTELGERLVSQGKREISQYWQQFTMTDVTAGNLQTFQTLFDMAQRMTAASDPLMGQQSKKRMTLGEINQLAAQGSQRMSLNAKIMDMMALQPLANRSIANRQQFTTLEQYIRITGELAKQVGKTRDVIGSRDIQGNFDYIPHSGVVSPDPARMAQTWIQLLTIGSKMGEFLLKPGPDGKAIDIREIFNEAARNLGVKNVEQFYHQVQQIGMPGMPGVGQPGGIPGAQVQVMPDEQVQRQVQAGNVIPMLGGGGQ